MEWKENGLNSDLSTLQSLFDLYGQITTNINSFAKIGIPDLTILESKSLFFGHF